MTPTLFGDRPDKKRRKPRAENADAVAELLTEYQTLFEARWKFKPRIAYGRDQKHLGELERTWGKDSVREMLQIFFTTTDMKVVRSDYSLLHFYGLAQHIKLISQREHHDERTQANIDAAARATGRR